MSKRSPRPRTTRRGKRPAEAETTALAPEAAPAEELPSIILADDLLSEPPPEPELAPGVDAPLPEPQDQPELVAHVDGALPEPPAEQLPVDESRPATWPQKPEPMDGSPGEDQAGPEPEAPPPARPAPLARVPLAPRPASQRYAPAYDDSAPIEIPRYIEEEPRRAWRPPEPARPAPSEEPPPWRRARPELDDDLEIDLRSNRRKYNWLLVLACVIVGILGVVLGSRPDKPPETPNSTASSDIPDVTAEATTDTSPAPTDTAPSSAPDTIGADAESADTAPRPTRPDVSPPNPKAARALDEAKRALDQRRWDGALHELDKALAEAPDNPRALFGRARALQQLGRHDEALRDANAVLAVDPSHPYALLLAAEALEKSGQPQEARTYYERYLAAWPKTRKAEELRKTLAAEPGK